MRDLAIGIALLMVGGAAFAAYRRQAIPADAAAPEDAPTAPSWWEGYAPDLGRIESLMQANADETNQKIQDNTAMIDTEANVRAFLETIARAEGTAGQPDPYRVCFGYSHTVQELSDHPAVTGEWKGKALPDNQCRAAGFGPGCVSTAAGKYQITKPTWSKLKTRLRLPDFGPSSQDAAAVELLRESGALQLIKLGNLPEAVNRARRTWASLPGAGYDQPERSLAWVQSQYTNAGGSLA